MARKCDISGKRTQVGNTISHSHIRTKRKFKVNLFKKKGKASTTLLSKSTH
ncbi:MAG: 50S ribosomal protein L28 [Candidatus Kapaibacteriota bacterium]